MTIVGKKSGGRRLKDRGPELLPNSVRHDASGGPFMNDALMYDQIPNSNQNLEDDNGWHPRFALIQIKCDQPIIRGINRT